MRPPAEICVMCKGTKRLCGLPYCPIMNKINVQLKLKSRMKESFFGPSHEVFVSSHNYPSVSYGPMGGLEEKIVPTKELYGLPYDRIIEIRSATVSGRRFTTVSKRMENEMRDVALSRKAVDVEMQFTKTPSPKVVFSSVVQPMGPSAPLRRFRQAENPKIPRRVDSVVDEGLKATEAVSLLWDRGYDNYYLTNIFATGAFGTHQKKKMVPTRWSITAMDDTLGKEMMKKVREFREISDILLFSNDYLHNHFEVLLIPGGWEFENFEAWSPKSVWAEGSRDAVVTEEYEPFGGRWRYADKQAGGYYASRFGVLEYLYRVRRQARAIVFREVGSGYSVPVGVWEVRENVRHAMMKRPQIFSTLKDAFDELKTRLDVPMKTYIKNSRVLGQSRLSEFF